MARCIDDVDTGVFPDDGRALGENGDATLALKVVAVHRTLSNLLMFVERAGLLEQFVNKGGLAMIDVCDNGDVANIHRKADLIFLYVHVRR
ncbi:hypothetical protein EMQ_1559 [Acetobacter aceti NBRC 14818]|uniref:Uncharacterized protein n=1 Tax=Acetobacter aceti NBRC 14818 TaxID=887700 RepID=A0AB33IG32_ACEAC|nr:hypothetical protein EMQ_1559 [Acetobacter aceti NBRC 14818]GAN58851.1 hypothetical protein Abac_086_017 [Acetobacter aceti NBRC 14818]